MSTGNLGKVAEREWDYFPEPDGFPFTDEAGNEVLGFHDQGKHQDEIALLAEFEAYYRSAYHSFREGATLILSPILVREATEVECKINGWEEGTFVRCTPRAKRSWPMWQIEVDRGQ